MPLKQLNLVLLFLAVAIVAHASHIVGGDIVYRKKDSVTYEVRLALYVDCVNGNPGAILFDTVANIGIYTADSQFFGSVNIYRNLPVRLNTSHYTCVVPPSNACIDMYLYEQEITLPVNNGGYFLVYQRCCRNKTISNLIDPDETGATYWTKIPGKSLVKNNSSPAFNSRPPNFLCVNQEFIFDHSATDPDGDSLVYELYVPYKGATPTFPAPRPPAGPPFQPVQWKNPYNLQNMMGGNPKLTIDSTGTLKAKPGLLGQFVVGITVKEYRNGVLIGETRRDYQFNVLACQFNVAAAFFSPPQYCTNVLTFTNNSLGDSFLWDFGVPNSTTDTSTAFAAKFTYPALGEYEVTLISYKGNCTDTLRQKIKITNNGSPFAGKDTTVCRGDSVQLKTTATAGFTYEWTPNQWLSNNNVAEPWASPLNTVTYTINQIYQNCIYSDSVNITVSVADAFFQLPDYCTNTVTFSNNNSIGDSFLWDFGVPGVSTDTSTAATVTFSYPALGNYIATLVAFTGNCRDTFQQTVPITHNGGLFAGADTSICKGDTFQLSASINPGSNYEWKPNLWLSDNTVPHPLAYPQSTITYILIEKNKNCIYTDSVEIEVIDPATDFTFTTEHLCEGNLVKFSGPAGFAGELEWYINNNLVSKENAPTFSFGHGENITGSLKAIVGACSQTKAFSYTLPGFDEEDYFIPNVITPNYDGLNECFELVVKPLDLACVPHRIMIMNRWGERIFDSETECWPGTYSNGKRVPAGTYFFLIEVKEKKYKGTVTVIY